jgi:hypothetical protein
MAPPERASFCRRTPTTKLPAAAAAAKKKKKKQTK